MNITGIQSISATRQRVWNALNDPAVLRQCLPGCESVERSSADEFRVVVAATVGPLRARFNGKLCITEAKPPESCTIVFEGQGGAVGFGKGLSSVTLSEQDGATELSYNAQAQVGGKLAQVGSRLIDSIAKKMSDDFFKALRHVLAPEVAPAAWQPANAGRQHALPAAAGALNPIAATAPGVLPAAPQTGVSTSESPRYSSAVPGWWLAVATLLGSAATMVGTLLAR
jgi:uncharacterized protein